MIGTFEVELKGEWEIYKNTLGISTTISSSLTFMKFMDSHISRVRVVVSLSASLTRDWSTFTSHTSKTSLSRPVAHARL
jgi:hypothetical protein